MTVIESYDRPTDTGNLRDCGEGRLLAALVRAGGAFDCCYSMPALDNPDLTSGKFPIELRSRRSKAPTLVNCVRVKNKGKPSNKPTDR